MKQIEVNQYIAAQCGISAAKVKEVFEAQSKLAEETLKTEDEFPLQGFGKLKTKQLAARNGRNPKTGDVMEIKASRQIKLAIGKNFKQAVQK